jgi:predicted lipoprotein with Yx(FWY)xxD motif
MTLAFRKSVTAALATGAAAVALSACGGDENGDGGNARAADPAAGSGIVSTQSIDGTDVLVDSEGRALYSAKAENGGRIRCTGECTGSWDPTSASATEADSASAELDMEFGVVMRPDGDRQLTLDGRPLYTFTEEGPGQLTGDGFVDDFEGTRFEWEAATVGGGTGSAGSEAPSDDLYSP